MPQDRHTPGFPQQTLAATATEVCHVGVVIREPKQPADRERARNAYMQSQGKTVSWVFST